MRMRIARRLLLALAGLAIVVASSACTPQEEDAFRSVNTLREVNGLRWLDWNEGAYDKAVAWSNHMADEGQLSHSVLAEDVPAGWNVLGENVAYAGTVAQAMQALEASPPHRANLLNPKFTSIAIGVVERDGRVWVTEVFIG
ncbi:MAG TPA: CAP domain-containing protein [Acidimicrobiales bacterium]|nr:CAP domain-containing protein [Acidimicrobiales bacterium]